LVMPMLGEKRPNKNNSKSNHKSHRQLSTIGPMFYPYDLFAESFT
jgi:hypothetical protein